jgi:ABC-type transport system substrate-binding protein
MNLPLKFGSILAAAGIILWVAMKLGTANFSIHSIYPVNYLRSDASLIDPHNTNTVWEYYLLENLACGLVRDSKTSPTNYEGCIAESFYQADPQTWIFKIRPLLWSDGNKVSKDDVLAWMRRLGSSSIRHVKFMRLADEIIFDEQSRNLSIRFKKPVGDVLLHELSLADAGLFDLDFKINAWKKTVGPYQVKSWDGTVLTLDANKNSPLYNDDIPKTVVLRDIRPDENRDRLFENTDVDIVPVGVHVDPRLNAGLFPNAPQIWESQSMSIVYFWINKSNRDANDAKLRQRFAKAVATARPQIADITTGYQKFVPHNQLIPMGFKGWLANYDEKQSLPETERSPTVTLTIRYPRNYEGWPKLADALIANCRDVGIELQLKPASSVAEIEPSDFAYLANFIGNQLDDSGTWAFLVGSKLGPMFPWKEIVAEKFESAYSGSLQTNTRRFDDLHQAILDSHIAIPLMLGKQRYLLSKQIDANNWNKFDARMRFYLLRKNHGILK